MVDGHPWGMMTKIQDYRTPSKVILRWFCEDFNLVRKWTNFDVNTLTLNPNSLGKVSLALNLCF